MKCVICGMMQDGGNLTKYRISEEDRVQSQHEAKISLENEVYRPISDLDSRELRFNAAGYQL